MSIWRLIGFLYYTIKKRYETWGEKDIADVYALCFISLLQLFNVFTVWLIALSWGIINIDLFGNYVFYVLFFVFLMVNFRYVRSQKFKESNPGYENKKDYHRRGRIAAVYVVFSIGAFLVSLLVYVFLWPWRGLASWMQSRTDSFKEKQIQGEEVLD